MGLILFWVLMGLVVAIVASSKGRSGFAWFLYGVVIWPVALVHAIVMPATAASIETKAMAEGDRRRCPFCAELIKAEAKVCRFCGRELPTAAAGDIAAFLRSASKAHARAAPGGKN